MLAFRLQVCVAGLVVVFRAITIAGIRPPKIHQAVDIDFGRPDGTAVIAEMRRFRAAVIEKL